MQGNAVGGDGAEARRAAKDARLVARGQWPSGTITLSHTTVTVRTDLYGRSLHEFTSFWSYLFEKVVTCDRKTRKSLSWRAGHEPPILHTFTSFFLMTRPTAAGVTLAYSVVARVGRCCGSERQLLQICTRVEAM